MQSTSPKPSMGILQLNEGEKKFQLERFAPTAALSPFIRHFWIINWDLEGQAPYLQDVLPNPCVNMVIEAHRSGIYGVSSSKYTKQIQGKGKVFGVKFKPGGFYPFLKTSLSTLTDQSIDIDAVFDADPLTFSQKILSENDPYHMIAMAEALFMQKLPSTDDQVVLVNEIIDHIHRNHDMTKVEHISEHFNMNTRRLQRLFSQYVGVSPKWVIKLYRLQNAAETMDTGKQQDWLTLSSELGYYDQSHFIKDFKAIIGKTPDEYAKAALTNSLSAT